MAGLVVTNNVSALTAQNNLSRTSNLLAKSLERLSTGLKINRGADGPAALIISELQRAQIAGLSQAIENTERGVSMVQTAEGALNELNSLLIKARELALDSANTAVNDVNTFAANQAELDNILDTIDRISANTQFGTRRLLDGSSGFSGSTSDTDVTFLRATTNSPTGSFAVNVTTVAERAFATAGTEQNLALAQNENVTVNGVLISLTSGSTQAQVVSRINEFTGQTGVTAAAYNARVISSVAYTENPGSTPATAGTLLNNGAGGLDQNTTAYVVGDFIDITGIDIDGTAVSASYTYVVGGTLGNLVTAISGAYANSTASIDASGNIVLTADNNTDEFEVSLTLADRTGNTGATTFATQVANGGPLRLRSNQFGAGSQVTVQSDVAAAATSSGVGTTQVSDTGVDVAGTIGGFAATGQGNVLTGATTAGAADISISLAAAAGSNIATVTGAQGNVTVFDNSLVFQIGANAFQTASVAIDDVGSDSLGLNVASNQFANLNQIDIQNSSGANDSIAVIDQAISDVSTLRGRLGAFQQNTLEAIENSLRATLENTVAAESIIRDTDFASEVAEFTKQQVLIQAGASVLTASNQIPQIALALLTAG